MIGLCAGSGLVPGGPGQVLRRELGLVHASRGLPLLRGPSSGGVSFGPPINDQLRTGTDKGESTV